MSSLTSAPQLLMGRTKKVPAMRASNQQWANIANFFSWSDLKGETQNIFPQTMKSALSM
jgi:hypothetical protein